MSCAPAILQESVSHTRTVSIAGASSPSFHDIEVMVERRDLVDGRHGKPHGFRQGCEMRSGQVAEPILHPVQVLYEVLGIEWCAIQRRQNLCPSGRIDSSSLGCALGPANLRQGYREFSHAASLAPWQHSAESRGLTQVKPRQPAT